MQRILVIDDSDLFRDTVVGMLESFDQIQIQDTASGEEGISLIQESHWLDESFSVVLLDWQMPGLSGREFIEKLRSTENFDAEPQIIIMTGDVNLEVIETSKRYKNIRFIQKPFTSEALNQFLVPSKNESKS